MRSANTPLPAVVLTPAVSIRSFRAMGMRGGPAPFAGADVSFRFAGWASAASGVTVIKAFRTGFWTSIFFKQAWVSSTGDRLVAHPFSRFLKAEQGEIPLLRLRASLPDEPAGEQSSRAAAAKPVPRKSSP
jgi:hypothetical protein